MIASIPHLLRDHFSGGFCLNGLPHECPLIVAWIRQVLRYNKIDLTFWQNKLDQLSAFFIFAGDIGRCLMNTRIDVSEILRIGYEDLNGGGDAEALTRFRHPVSKMGLKSRAVPFRQSVSTRGQISFAIRPLTANQGISTPYSPIKMEIF